MSHITLHIFFSSLRHLEIKTASEAYSLIFDIGVSLLGADISENVNMTLVIFVWSLYLIPGQDSLASVEDTLNLFAMNSRQIIIKCSLTLESESYI